MKKFVLFSFVILISFLGSIAQNVKLEDAKIVAKNAYAERLNAANLKTNFTLSDTYFAYPSETNKAFYIFEPTDRAGYIIVSAEKSMHPLLAYSFESFFNENSTPPAFWYLLDEYTAQIEYIRTNKTLASQEIVSEWDHYLNPSFNKSILNINNQTPLLTTRWNQDCFYNELCPIDANGPCGFVYAGCVATAMGQVMKYHNWPIQGSGSSSYTHSTYGMLSADYGNTTYLWDSMPNQLSGSNLEVAKLLFHAGVSVNMNYSPSGSGAQSNSAANSLKTYFKYANYLTYLTKASFDNNSWIQLLRNDLSAKRPIYYSGRNAQDYGHAFVCDGFQNNSFHFDFGWGGSSNGYFLITQVGGFNVSQAAILNAEPLYTGPQYCNSFTTITDPAGTINDGSGSNTRYANNTSCKWLIQVADAEAIALSFTRLNTEPGLDRILVYEGTSESGRLLADISGFELPTTPLVAGGNSMFIWFVTDEMSAAFGWEANYTSWMTNINDEQNAKISISPNPTSDFINIKFDNISNQNVSLNLYNINGQIVISNTVNLNNNNYSFDVSNLSKGIYNLEIKTDDNRIFTEKIILK